MIHDKKISNVHAVAKVMELAMKVFFNFLFLWTG
jgi:hypothetical protein